MPGYRTSPPLLVGGGLLAAALLGVLVPRHEARADVAANVAGKATTSLDGQVISAQGCQGCHMANARGGVGAARIPALAANTKLSSSGYPVYVVLNGYGGMPWLGEMLNDAQVASVVTYVRSHFGNSYTDVVKPEDVAAVRGPSPTMER